MNAELLSSGKGKLEHPGGQGSGWEEVGINQGSFDSALRNRPIYMNVSARFECLACVVIYYMIISSHQYS